MNYIKYLFLLFGVISEKTIRNINIPSCKNCIYYKPVTYSFDFTDTFSRCEKFGEKNIINDKINYDFTESSRNDELKCGKEGKYFEENDNIYMKIFIHKFSYTLTVVSPLLGLFIFYIYLLSLEKK